MIAFSKSGALSTAVLTIGLLFVISLASSDDATPTPIYCIKTSDCGDPSTHQDCVNGICGCIIGYTWDNNTFLCTVKPCKKDTDCLYQWPHSVCSNSKSGMCVCDKKYHVDKFTQTCKLNSAQSIQSVLMLLVVALGASFLRQMF